MWIYIVTFSRLKSTTEELVLTQKSLQSKEDLMVDLQNKIEEYTKNCEKKSEYVEHHISHLQFWPHFASAFWETLNFYCILTVFVL